MVFHKEQLYKQEVKDIKIDKPPIKGISCTTIAE
jgi:hypothetical protein